jgi:hypothetical protein
MGICYYIYGEQTESLFDFNKGGWWLREALADKPDRDTFVGRGHAAWEEEDDTSVDPYFVSVLTQLWRFCAKENEWRVHVFSDSDDEFYEKFPRAEGKRVIAYDRFDLYHAAIARSVQAGQPVLAKHCIWRVTPDSDSRWVTEVGRNFANLLLQALEPGDWCGLSVDLRGVPAAGLIGGFFNAFLLRVHQHDDCWVPLARKITWLTDHAFQAELIKGWMADWKAP